MSSALRTAAFVYARLDSSRLPGKALRYLGHETLIEAVCRRTSRAQVDEVVLLTTHREVDDQLADFCERRGYAVFRGHATDLVRRTQDALDHYGVERFVRVNGDCPLVEPKLIDACLERMEFDVDLASNLFTRTFPYGIAVECVLASAYRRWSASVEPEEAEHVTLHLYRLQERMVCLSMLARSRVAASERFVVDTEQDLRRLQGWLAGGSIGMKHYWDLLGESAPRAVFEVPSMRFGVQT